MLLQLSNVLKLVTLLEKLNVSMNDTVEARIFNIANFRKFHDAVKSDV